MAIKNDAINNLVGSVFDDEPEKPIQPPPTKKIGRPAEREKKIFKTDYKF